VTAERGHHRKPYAFVSCSRFRDEARQVLGHVPPWGKHERVNNYRGRTLLDAAREALSNRGLCDLHVRRLHDAFGAEALSDQGSDFIEQRVGRSPPTPMVDQEYRRALTRRLFARAGRHHRAYLGHWLRGVKNRGRRENLTRSRRPLA